MQRLIPWLTALPMLCVPARADVEGIRATVEFMASVGSRVSGYPGSDRAADYVADAFAAAGVQAKVAQHSRHTGDPVAAFAPGPHPPGTTGRHSATGNLRRPLQRLCQIHRLAQLPLDPRSV